MTAIVPADQAITQVAGILNELPVYIAGSSLAATTSPNLSFQYDDIDVFASTDIALAVAAERLKYNGFAADDRFERVFARWVQYGFNRWHTNSLKLEGPNGMKVNLVYKLVDGHPTTSLAQVIESFDFGLLSTGFDCELGIRRNMYDYLFPGMDPQGPLPMMPKKASNWRQGFISQYNGLRELGRYAKYHGYGFDMSAVKDDLVTGYWAASKYLQNRTDSPDKVQLGVIYETIAMLMDADDFTQMAEAGKEILYLDSLDAIMEALE